ncbi:sugar 3,4-ketoisomerase [Aquirufa echingensis]|uniref:FdtA/QdtA family cupin domain-containing protein n=1 Tax=Aquirufa echingensis TaxID=3096516 RepID=A0ABW6CX33_9BACT
MSYRLIQFPKIVDPRGNLTFLQNPEQIPFQIERVFWTYDVPGGEKRGGHSFKTQHEVIIALSGSFDVVVFNESGEKSTFSLNRSYFGLYLPPSTWRQMENFSTNSLALHLSSSLYDPNDYVRDINDYLRL